MNTSTRTYNVVKNVISNFGTEFVNLVLKFVTRIIFIKVFGENYLGINGLFTNILTLLSLAELGIGGAIVYNMYKPIAEKNYNYLSALMNYYKKLYRIIGLVVCVIGLMIVPLLKYIVNLEVNVGNITFFYLLYLANTVSSYFLIYKTSILIADQKNYVIKICNAIVNVVKFAALTAAAYLFKNFYIYLTIQIAFSVIANYVSSKEAEKRYPFITEKFELPKEDKKNLWNNVTHMFMYQLGYVILNNTDNILISIMVGTVAVGFYSNYSMIIMEINILMQLFFSAFQSSIGNLGAVESADKQYEVYKTISLISFVMNSIISIVLSVIIQDSIKFLYTDHYLLGNEIVWVCIFNFYIYNMLQPIYCFRNTIGLFKQTKTIMLYTSLVNLVLSVILGKFMGLFGILFATGIARVVTNLWYEPLKLFKIYFKKPVKYYYFTQIVLVLTTVLTAGAVLMCTNKICIGNLFIQILIKAIIAGGIPAVVYLLLFKKKLTAIFKQYKKAVKIK